METDYIPELIALAEYGSSYVAAEKLFISQSSLLRHVQSIEEELGMPLFERSRKGFVLNEAGERFLPYARQIYALKERCCSVLHQEDSGKTLRLYAEGKIIDLMIDFRKHHPEFRLENVRPEDPEEALRQGKLDIAFLTNIRPTLADQFRSIPFAEEEVLALLYTDHPLAGKESVSLEELSREPLITLTEEPFTVSRDGYGALPQNARLDIAASVLTGNDLLRMVRERCGIALIHGRRDTIPAAGGLKVLPLDPPMKYSLNIYYRSDTPLSQAAAAFLRFAERWTALHGNTNLSLIEG